MVRRKHLGRNSASLGLPPAYIDHCLHSYYWHQFKMATISEQSA